MLIKTFIVQTAVQQNVIFAISYRQSIFTTSFTENFQYRARLLLFFVIFIYCKFVVCLSTEALKAH